MTTKEILNYLHEQFPATVGHVPLERMLERFALDHMKEGVIRAATECEPFMNREGFGQVVVRATAADIRNTILSTVTNWTEADL